MRKTSPDHNTQKLIFICQHHIAALKYHNSHAKQQTNGNKVQPLQEIYVTTNVNANIPDWWQQHKSRDYQPADDSSELSDISKHTNTDRAEKRYQLRIGMLAKKNQTCYT